MKSKSLAIALFIAVALFFVNIPFIDGKSIAALIVLIVGIILLIKK